MAAFGESCRRCGHGLAAATDPEPPSAAQLFCIAKFLFDHLVDDRQQRFRDGKAEGLGGFHVDSFVDCTTKRSAGLAPLRILPV
jgi:hypothetical protein